MRPIPDLIVTAIFICTLAVSAFAEITIEEKNGHILTYSPYVRTDLVALGNTVDLDNKVKDDQTTYIGLEYSAALDLKFQEKEPEFHIKFERRGPYDYDMPLFIDHTLQTSLGKVKGYRDAELLPDLAEFWGDVPLPYIVSRVRAGVFTYSVGHGIAVAGAYDNYGMDLYHDSEDLKWHLYYCYPDLANKHFFGPSIIQEKEQGQAYQHSKANFFAADMSMPLAGGWIQPYVSMLVDHTGPRRLNYFSTPTVRDILGTVGVSQDFVIDKLSIGLEAARNFGRAESDSPDSKYVEHCGYLLYTDVAYELERIKPRARFVYASGNEVTTDMVANGDTVLTSGKNRAFSVYSPLNNNLWDAIYPKSETMPLVAMDSGWGLNYGVNRPGTFGDPRLFENIVLMGTGFDCQLTEKFSFAADWWHMRSAERGIGMLAGSPRELSPDLGNEVDVSITFTPVKHVTITVYGGYFLPGKFYKEYRDDSGGSLLTPFIRGDGEADPAYQIESSIAVEF